MYSPTLIEGEPPAGLHAADGSLVENLYCLTCGYNLRGLRGDPVRCPECGHENDLGTVRIPAQAIQEALRRMETAPTMCCGLAVLMLCVSPWLLLGLNPVPAVLVPLAAGWGLAMSRTRLSCEGREGWKRVLFDFHVATLLGACPLLWTWVWFVLTESRGHVGDGRWILLGWCASVPTFVGAVFVYRGARGRLCEMQRDTAVQLARRTLRMTLARSRVRSAVP